MNAKRRAWSWPALVVGGAVVGGLALIALSGNPLWAVLVVPAMIGAAATALLVPSRPAAAVGVVFLLAVLERVAIDTPLGDVRMEQPAIASLLVAVIWHRRALDLPPLRRMWPLILTALAFLAVMALSSVLVADEPLLSLRMVAWTAASMVLGLLAALLLAGRVRDVMPWLSGAGVLVALTGLAVAVSYLAVGHWSGLLGGPNAMPRVFLPAYEPNLYASLLATIVPIALERYRSTPTTRTVAWLIIILAAIGIGVTRAAYIALAVGLVAYVGLHLRLARPGAALRRAIVVTLLAGALGMVLPRVLLNPDLSGVLLPPANGGQPPAGPVQPRPIDDLDTWEYRMVRVETGLSEMQRSPIIGLGAFSYGQRHVGPNGVAEVIAVLPILVLHDAGILGFAALAAFFVLLALRLWRTSGDSAHGPPAIALAAAVAIMLTTYLSTSALHFAVSWLVIGAAVAATLPRPIRA